MKILHEETYEREGNDAWLIDKIQIIKEDGELILRHKVNHNGWNGPVRGTTEINLDEFNSIEYSQNMIRQYMENSCLTPEMKVPNLTEILQKQNEY